MRKRVLQRGGIDAVACLDIPRTVQPKNPQQSATTACPGLRNWGRLPQSVLRASLDAGKEAWV